MKNKRLFTIALCSMCCIQAVVVLLSWILSSLYPESSFRSMLRGEAVRWFCGHFVEFCASPCLVWIVLLSMSAGTCLGSGILSVWRTPPAVRRRAIAASAAALVVCLSVTAMLTLAPHAVLLSAVGQLFPSPFSMAAVPMVSLLVFIVSVIYGTVAGNFRSVCDVACSLSAGVRGASPLLVLYVFAAVTVNSVLYVFWP